MIKKGIFRPFLSIFSIHEASKDLIEILDSQLNSKQVRLSLIGVDLMISFDKNRFE